MFSPPLHVRTCMWVQKHASDQLSDCMEQPNSICHCWQISVCSFAFPPFTVVQWIHVEPLYIYLNRPSIITWVIKLGSIINKQFYIMECLHCLLLYGNNRDFQPIGISNSAVDITCSHSIGSCAGLRLTLWPPPCQLYQTCNICVTPWSKRASPVCSYLHVMLAWWLNL